MNECLDESQYECADELQRCVNIRGSFVCECEPGFIWNGTICLGKILSSVVLIKPYHFNLRTPSTRDTPTWVAKVSSHVYSKTKSNLCSVNPFIVKSFRNGLRIHPY